MTRDVLCELISYWMDATSILQRIKDAHRCGASASDESLTPALKKALDNILRLQSGVPASDTVVELNMNPDDYTKKRKRVLHALDELEACKKSRDRARIVNWAGTLVQAAGDLAAGYLFTEADNILGEKDDANRP